jgi:hypothetical protein
MTGRKDPSNLLLGNFFSVSFPPDTMDDTHTLGLFLRDPIHFRSHTLS